MSRRSELLQAAARHKPNIEINVYEGGGHASDNPNEPSYVPDTAARAWERTAAFLAAHLGGRG